MFFLDRNYWIYRGPGLVNGFGGDSGSDAMDNGGSGITAAGQSVVNASKQTPEEAAQYSDSFDIGKFLKQYFGYQLGENDAPTGYKSPTDQFTADNPLGQSLYDQTLKDVQDPTASYESVLQPSLEQAQNSINSYYQSRGLINSGIAIGDMGTAGVDLAIQEAQGKMAARQTALSNASTLENNIYSNSNTNATNLANLYSNEQASGQNSLNRQATGAASAAGYQAYPYQAQLGSYYGGVAAQQALPGQVISAGAKLVSAAA